MFYIKQKIRTTLHIKPIDLHKISDYDFISDQLSRKVQGRCYSEFGYIIYVVLDKDSHCNSDPIIDEDGYIKLTISFDAVIFKPYIGEVIDCFV